MGNGTWRIARSRSGAHLPLVIVAALAIALILIGKAQSSLFDRARTDIVDWMRPALVATRAPIEAVSRWLGSIGEIFVVYQENLKLKEENARLRQWQNTAIVLNDRIKRYQLLLHAAPDPELTSVVAQVIGRASHPFQQTMILDAGSDNGVKPGQAVVDQRGMIGTIFLTGKRTSWVILLTDLNSRVPISAGSQSVQAIMAGDNTQEPVIQALPQRVQLKPGDQVVSSGDGDILPSGIPIGIVVPDGERYRVALFADQSTAQDVQILDFKLPPEQPSAASQKDLPVTAAGLPPVPSPRGANPSAARPGARKLEPVYKPAVPLRNVNVPAADDETDNDVPNTDN